MSAQKEAVRQQVRLLQAQAHEEEEANQAGMINLSDSAAFDWPRKTRSFCLLSSPFPRYCHILTKI